MVIVLALLLGLDDGDALMLMAAAMMSVVLFGCGAEIMHSRLLHAFGWFPFSVVWFVLFRAYQSAYVLSSITAFLYYAVFLIMSLFGVVQMVHLFVGVKNYRTVEYSFTALSLCAKTSMAMLVFLASSNV